MKAWELIAVGRPVLDALTEAGITPADMKFLEMHRDFIRMKAEGQKVTYVVAYLAEYYDIPERRVYKIISKLNLDLSLC